MLSQELAVAEDKAGHCQEGHGFTQSLILGIPLWVLEFVNEVDCQTSSAGGGACVMLLLTAKFAGANTTPLLH